MKNILSPQYNAREAVTLAGSLNVKTIDEIKNRIIALSNGKNKKSSINLIADIPDVVSLQIPAAVQLDIIGNGYSLNANFIIDGEASVSGAILSGTFKGTGKASFTSCEFTRNSFLISAVDGWSFSDCVFPNTIGTATLTNVVLRGRAKTGIETEISVGTLQNCDIELVGGINSTSPVNSLITLNGDWTNLGSLGTGTNIIARNIPLPMGGGSALPPNGDYGDITVSGTGNVWTIDASAVTTTKIADDAVTFAKMQNITTDRLLGRDTAGTGNVEEISLNSTLSFTGAGAIQRAALTGDVTASAGSNATTIAANAVTNTKLRDSVGLSVIGNIGATTADPQDIVASVDFKVLRRNGTTLGFGDIEQSAVNGLVGDLATKVTGPSFSVLDNTVVRFDGTTGTLIQSSPITLSDTGVFAGLPNPTNSDEAANKAYVDSSITAAVTLSNNVPIDVSNTVGFEGTSTEVSRSDHSHFHGTLTAGNLHAPADYFTNGFLANTDKIIIDDLAAKVVDGDKGDITVSSGFTNWSIDANVVSDTKLRDSVGLSVIGRASNTTGDPADIVAASGNTVLRRVGSTLAFGTIPQASVDNLVSDLQDRIIGPSSADDNAITRFDGPSGKYVQNSAVTLDDNGVLGWAGINAQLTTTKSAQLYADTDKNGLNLFEIYRQADLTLDLTHDGVFTVGRDIANVMLRSTLKTNKFGWADEATTYITHPSTLNQLHIVSDGSITSKFYGVQQLNLADDPTTPAYSFQGYEGFGMTLNSAGTSLSLVNAGETVATVDSDGLQVTSSTGVANVTGNALINQFAVGTATYSFYGDTDTGMLRWAADEIGWNCGGTTKMILTANELNVLGNVKRNSTSSTSNANFIVDAENIAIATWVASFTAGRTLQVSNMIAGRSIKILMRNTNATARVITIQASATTSGYANVICTGNTAGAASVSTVSLAATSGTAIVEIFATAGGIFGRLG